jgi:hypothetical protein
MVLKSTPLALYVCDFLIPTFDLMDSPIYQRAEAVTDEWCLTTDAFALACSALFKNGNDILAVGAAASCAVDDSANQWDYSCTTVAATSTLSAPVYAK